MSSRTIGLALASAGLLAIAPLASADYDSHPELKPENRCIDENGERFDPWPDGSQRHPTIEPIHCQKLLWDLPATGELGAVRVGAPFFDDPIPRFPRGVTDRPPPMYVDADGNGYEQPGTGRELLCHEFEVPYWKPLLNEDGSPVTGTDENGFIGVASDGSSTGEPQEGPLFEVACHRGSRAYVGPWQTATDANKYDELSDEMMTRFENTDRLNHDVDVTGLATEDHRIEWSLQSEFYNHFSSHHGTCWGLPHDYRGNCNNPNAGQTKPREAFQPGGECYDDWHRHGEPDGQCYSANADSENCSHTSNGGGFRNATQIPGRLSVSWADTDRGVAEVEDQTWACNHHVVTQLPPGSYGMDTLANYRLQKGGVRNPRTPGVNCGLEEDDPDTSIDETRGCSLYGVPGGEVMGGAVGEMIIQNLTAPALGGTKPLNVMFNAAADLATTWYPPFTWNYHTSLWSPPFDSALTITAIHSHHRMVKGVMDVVPVNPVRPNSPDYFCGGSADPTNPAPHVYENWEWEDARVCQYWKDPDGPLVMRKGQALATTCYVNNGVTPEAIKHGLVAGSTIEQLKLLGAPIPDYPETGVPASTWGDPLAQSPVGQELLYGTHPPINYRVVYKCATAGLVPGVQASICNPNPAVDADGDYIDGPYANPEQCGDEGVCAPGVIRFACIGEDEMCIGVAAYYALDRLGDTDGGHDQAVENLTNPDTSNPFTLGNDVGTPGNAGADTSVSGQCPECEPGL